MSDSPQTVNAVIVDDAGAVIVIDKNLTLGLIEGVQWAEINPAKLRDHLDKAEERLDKLPLLFSDLLRHSENVTHLKSYLAQIRERLDKAKIPSSKLTPEQRKFYNKVVQMKAAQKAAGVQGWKFGSGVYDEDALREVSNRIANLEKRIQKAVDRAEGALGGKVSADKKRRKNREKAGNLWERLRKSGKSEHVCYEEIAVKMKKDTRTIQRWRKNDWQ
jgi:hypothetical protein